MKIYLVAIMMVFISSKAMACKAATEERIERFIKYDLNKDGYVDADELKKFKPDYNFEEILKTMDKDSDNKLSKKEFTIGVYFLDATLCMDIRNDHR